MTQEAKIKTLSKEDSELQKDMLHKISIRIKLLNYVSNGIEIYGMDKFKSEIKQLNLIKPIKGILLRKEDREGLFSSEQNMHMQKIISICESEFCKINKGIRVTFNDVLEKEKRRTTTDLRRLIVYNIIKNTKVSPTKLGLYLKRSRQIVHLLLKESEKMIKNPRLVRNKQFIEICNKIK